MAEKSSVCVKKCSPTLFLAFSPLFFPSFCVHFLTHFSQHIPSHEWNEPRLFTHFQTFFTHFFIHSLPVKGQLNACVCMPYAW